MGKIVYWEGVGVDPRVHAVAEVFVEDLLDELRRSPDTTKLIPPRPVLVQRAAAAMQQAVEHELEAIREELTT